jgi:hypothetical protein
MNIKEQIEKVKEILESNTTAEVDIFMDSDEEFEMKKDTECEDDGNYHITRSGIMYCFGVGEGKTRSEVPKSYIKLVEKTLKQFPKVANYQDNKDYNNRSAKALIAAKDEIKVKYYLWDWCMAYGWRAEGDTEGYNSLKELNNSKLK